MPKDKNKCRVATVKPKQKFSKNKTISIPPQQSTTLVIPDVSVKACGQTVVTGSYSFSLANVSQTQITILYDVLRDKTNSLVNGPQTQFNASLSKQAAITVPLAINVVDTDVKPGIHNYSIVIYNQSKIPININIYSLRVQSLGPLIIKPSCSDKKPKSRNTNYLVPYVYENQTFPSINQQNDTLINVGATYTIQISKNVLSYKKCSGVTVTGSLIVVLPVINGANMKTTDILYNITRGNHSLTNGFQTLIAIEYTQSVPVNDDFIFGVSINAVDDNVSNGEHSYTLTLKNKSSDPINIRSYSIRARSFAGSRSICANKYDNYKQSLKILSSQQFPKRNSKPAYVLQPNVTQNLDFPNIRLKRPRDVIITGTLRLQNLDFVVQDKLNDTININVFYNIYRDGKKLLCGDKQLMLFSFLPVLSKLVTPVEINFVDTDVPRGKHHYEVKITNHDKKIIAIDVYSLRLEY